MTAYSHIERGVRNDQSGEISIQYCLIGRCGQRVAAIDAMVPGLPNLAQTRNGLLSGSDVGGVIVGLAFRTFKNDIDLGGFKSDDGKVEVDIEISKKLNFLSQHLWVPS